MSELAGKNVIIIGGAGGAGSGFSRYFASCGMNVLVNDAGFEQKPDSGDYDTSKKSRVEADKVVSQITVSGGIAEADYEDASTSSACKRITEHCLDRFGSVDIVVHAANVSHLGMIENLSDNDWKEILAQNVDPAFYMIRETLPYMRAQKYGRHIFLGSATIREMWGGANYAAASGALYSLMRSVALETKGSGITANAIEPWTQTKTGQRPNGKKMLEDRKKALNLPDTPSKPLPVGDTNAPLGAYLCTKQGEMFSGQYFSNAYGRICLFSTMLEQRYIYKDIENEGYWTVEELKSIMPSSLGLSIQPLWHDRI